MWVLGQPARRPSCRRRMPRWRPPVEVARWRRGGDTMLASGGASFASPCGRGRSASAFRVRVVPAGRSLVRVGAPSPAASRRPLPEGEVNKKELSAAGGGRGFPWPTRCLADPTIGGPVNGEGSEACAPEPSALSVGVEARKALGDPASVRCGDPGHGPRRRDQTMRHWITSFQLLLTGGTLHICYPRRKSVVKTWA